MNIYFPDNIFARFLIKNFSKEEKEEIIFSPSSILSKRLIEDTQSVALIPTLELITNKDSFVSESIGISFEGRLSNSYLYFKPGQKKIGELKLAGDISSMDVILSKILFKEVYNSDIKINIQTRAVDAIDGNYLITGDENYKNGKYEKGISFAEQMVEMISAPYVGYILASFNEKLLKEYAEKLLSVVENLEYENIEIFNRYNMNTMDFLRTNFNSIYYKFDQQDKTGVTELLRLPYYHGLVEDIVEVKFI